MWFPLSCIALFFITVVKAQEDPYTICPEPERISPCECEKDCDDCQAVIVCKNILTQTTLEEILEKNGDFPFRSALIKDSTFQYIPNEVFLKNRYIFLTLKNCTLVQILEDDIQGDIPLKQLSLVDMNIQKKISYRRFTNFQSLELLYLNNTEYRKIRKSDMEFLSPTLKLLFFINTKTSRIEPDAFKSLNKLESLIITKNEIKNIESNMFPESLSQLILNDNKLKSIPSDLSDALPKLFSIYLQNNLITSFPEAPFGKFPDLAFILIQENPIKCDCQSRWVVGREKPYIEGTCSDRKDKKPIKELTREDFAYCA